MGIGSQQSRELRSGEASRLNRLRRLSSSVIVRRNLSPFLNDISSETAWTILYGVSRG